MPKGLIVSVQPEHDIPLKYQALALKAYPNAFGGVVATKVEGKPRLLVSTLDGAIPVDEMAAAQKDFHDQKKVYFFGDFPAGYSADDVQPFNVLVDDKEMPLVVAFMEGDFSPFHKPDGKHSDEFNAFEEMLRPTIKDVFESDAVERDIDKLINVLDHDTKLKRTLELMCRDRGTVTLVMVNGIIRTPVFKNDLHRQYDWGAVSNHMGYVEEPAKVEGAAPEKRGFLQHARTVVAEAIMPTTKGSAILNQPAPQDVKTATAVPSKAGISQVTAIIHEREKLMKLSSKILEAPVKASGRPLKNWCHNNLGYLPMNWRQHGEDGFILTAYVAMNKLSGVKDAEIKSFSDPRLANAIGGEPAAAKAEEVKPKLSASERRRLQLAATKSAGEHPKEEEATPQKPKEVPSKPAEAPVVEPLPSIIPKEEIQGLIEWHKKYTGYDGKEIVIDPELMPALAEDVPSYAEQAGRQGLEFVFYMSLADIADHQKRFPRANVNLMKNLINLLADTYKEEQDKPVVLTAAERRKLQLARKAG